VSQPGSISSLIFVNHGSSGACPRPVFQAYQRWQRDLERPPVEFLGRCLAGLIAEARTALEAYVGAGADDLVYVPNATTGLNIVARSLELAPGDEVLATDHDYGALDRTWRTAIILPVAELVRRAREAGIITVIDGTHAPGQIPLDLESLGADFYAGNCHKWQ
jgi:isopenicillin-N epimerase